VRDNTSPTGELSAAASLLSQHGTFKLRPAAPSGLMQSHPHFTSSETWVPCVPCAFPDPASQQAGVLFSTAQGLTGLFDGIIESGIVSQS
jgi:hypothetical protein